MTPEEIAEEHVISLFETSPEHFERATGIGVIRHPESDSLLVVIVAENPSNNLLYYRLPLSVFDEFVAQFQQSPNA